MESFYQIKVDKKMIADYFKAITKVLILKTYVTISIAATKKFFKIKEVEKLSF